MFTAKKVEELPSFGDKLKKARERVELQKEKAAEYLNVRYKFLDRLESGELDKLPADVYTKGFLKKYAKILELDCDALVLEFENEKKIFKHLKKSARPHSLPELRFRRFIITPRFFVYALAAVISFFILSYFAYQLNFLLSPPNLSILEPASDFATNNSELIVRGKTDPGTKLSVNGQQVYATIDGNFEQKLNLNKGLNVIKIEAVNRFGKTKSLVKEILLKQE